MSQWPHDDTRSLTEFYGAPNTPSNMVLVVPPWPITYRGRPCRGVRIHRKCAQSLKAVFDDIASQVGHDWGKLPPGATKFSGSFNPRPVRGSSRPSCHAFGAAMDWDADDNQMNTDGDKGTMSPIVISAFKRQGWYWGGDFHSRQDPMHFQAANEDSRVADLAGAINPISAAYADETPPHEEGDSLAAENTRPQATIEELPPSAQEAPQGQSQEWISSAVTQNIPKSLWSSKIAWGAGGLGGSAATTAVVNDQTTQSIVARLVHQPTFWLVAVIVVLTIFIIWSRFTDHGRGQK